jgi:hypothetical protein
MKLTKSTYFSIFFLLCFVASFGAKTLQNLNTKACFGKFNHKELAVVSHKYDNGSSSNDLLLEETENETEDVFFIQAFTLPYFITYFQYDVLKTQTVSANPLAEKLKNPIYIAICNFRI